MKTLSIAAALLGCAAFCMQAFAAAPLADSLADIRAFRTSHAGEILEQYVELLKIPNVASDRANIRRNADAIVAIMQRLSLAPRLLEPAAAPDTPPLIYGEWKVPGAKRTLVLYAHYDGQPVNPAEWASGPFSPTLRTGPAADDATVISMDAAGRLDPQVRVYARGASDDKAGVIVILSAVEALRALHRQPTDNLKIVFEGEEEAGSPHLGDILRENRPLFTAQLWVVCDGPVHQSGRKQVIYGARGDLNVSLTVYGPNRPLHSGHYGNWAPNPALRLARLLTSMKDEAGKVIVPGWYDDVAPLGETERRAIAAATEYDETLRRQLGLAATETDRPLNEAITLPSLNINGMRSGNVGDQATNMIAQTATAVLDLRLVLGNDPQRQYDKLLAHVRSKGYYVIDREPTAEERLAHPLIATMMAKPGSYAAARTPMDDPFARTIAAAVRASSDQAIVELPTSGGSLPLAVISEALGTRSIVVGIANYDNNQHAANENLRLGNLWDGIDLYGAVLTHPATAAPPANLSVAPCKLQAEENAACGTFIVPENWGRPQGRQIKLNLIILPSRLQPAREPVFFLSGGPGQTATESATIFATSWEREEHDLVLVDFRGTSADLRLDCALGGSDDNPQGYLEPLFFEGTDYRTCAAALSRDADLTQYTTPAAVKDLDALRQALGYDKINLEGGSYGTREAIAYIHAFSPHVRAALLSGLVPLSDTGPLNHAAAAQRAFDILVSQCQADSTCNTAYPHLHEDLATILQRLRDQPVKVTVGHPATGAPIELSLPASAFGDGLRVMLYSTQSASRIPLLIKRALAGDLRPFAEAALHYSRSLRNSVRVGLLLSVTCPEDVARIRPEEIARATAGSFIGDYRVRGQMAACSVWPRGKIPKDYFAPFRSEVPALLISGNLDPVTPPKWGDETRKTFPHSLHIVVPGGHVSDDSCLDSIGRRFFATASVTALDTGCVTQIRNPPFAVTD